MGAGSRQEALRARTNRFAIASVRLFLALPKSPEAHVLGRQLLRAGTSVAANYRAVCRARTRAEFVATIRAVLEEADESLFCGTDSRLRNLGARAFAPNHKRG